MPVASSTARTVSASRSWFFGANASIDGAIRWIRSESRCSHANAAREKMNASAASTYGRRNSHASRTVAFGSSSPMWQRQITLAPAAQQRLDQPRGLRVVQDHDVAAAIAPASASPSARSVPS